MDPLGQVYQGVGGTGAAVIIEAQGLDPVALHAQRVNQYWQNKAAEAQVRQQQFDAAFKQLNDFKGDGWYQHDKYLKEMSNTLTDELTTAYIGGGNPFDPSDSGYIDFSRRMKDIESAHNYSKQIKDYHDEVFTKMQGAEPGTYTAESMLEFEAFYSLPFEEQLQTKLPVLVETPEATDWYGDFTKTVKPSTKYTRIDENGVSVTNQKANKDANAIIVNNWLDTYAGRDELLAYFNGDVNAAIDFLNGDVNSRADITYMKSVDPADVFGTGSADDNNPLGLGTRVYEVPFVPGGDKSFGTYETTATNEYALNGREIIINTPEYFNVSTGKWNRGVAENINFIPEGVVRYNVAGQATTFTYNNQTFSLEEGDIIPDEWISTMKSQNVLIQQRDFVRGIERYVEETTVPVTESYADRVVREQQGVPLPVETEYSKREETVYVPLDYVQDDLVRSVKGYGNFVADMNKHQQYNAQSGIFSGTGPAQINSTGITWE